MYNQIYDLCRVRNQSAGISVGPTQRVKFLMKMLDHHGIDYELDQFEVKWSDAKWHNLILPGSSSRMVVAHHDVVNVDIDNANDNSASLINAVMIKKLMPHIHVVLLDGEERGGLGSQRLSDQINQGKFGHIDWVLNLELTGRGGSYFCIDRNPGVLNSRIVDLFGCPTTHPLYNDSVTIRRNNIDSCVIFTLPPAENESVVQTKQVWWNDVLLDYSIVSHCHNKKDCVDAISVDDMKTFVEKVAVPILE